MGQCPAAVPPSQVYRTMPVDMVAMLLAALLAVSLGTLGTLHRLSRRNELLEGKVRRLEEENRALKELIEEERRTLEERLKRYEERIAALEDLALGEYKHPKPRPRENTNNRGEDGELEEEVLNLRILALYRNGYSIRQIARELGLSKSTVHRRLKRFLNGKT